MVPVQVSPADLDAVLHAADGIENLDGIVATVPHKFACYRHRASATRRSRVPETVNVMRRRPDGLWHGEMVDGEGLVRALRRQGRVAGAS